MEYAFVFGLMFLVVALISWSWVKGIDNMTNNHPDYKGDDFLNWGDEEIDDEFSRQCRANNVRLVQDENDLKEKDTETKTSI